MPKDHLFTQCWRWYGPNDPVSLWDIRQAGASGIVTALHQIPVGETWERAAIAERKKTIEDTPENTSPLRWEVVESLPVHDAIKRGAPAREVLIDQYCQSLENLGKEGIRVVCYNFMPVLDWLRTDLTYPMPNGARSLRFDYLKLVIFDRFLLERAGAANDYPAALNQEAEVLFAGMSAEEKHQLENTILLGLPGDSKNFTRRDLREGLKRYQGIDAAQLRKNLVYFLKKAAPAAEAAGVRLAIHPDDPPWSVFGLPRVVSNLEDLNYLLQAVDSPANGLTYCTGSLGASSENDLPRIAREWIHRIHFLHLRAVSRWGYRNFMEADHLDGDTDLFSVVNTLWTARSKLPGIYPEHFALPMRPDHGMQMLDDLHKTFYPGYSAIGRLKGLAELRGLELALSRIESAAQGK